MPRPELLEEVRRQFVICNACRYCEGFCAVFPAIELRTEFAKQDIIHIANLCHDCRSCYYACMYAPPHEFNVNFPLVLSAVRDETYRETASPAALGRLLGGGLRGTLVAALLGVLFVLGLVFSVGQPKALLEAQTGPGSLYRILPYAGMVVPFVVLGFLVLAAMASSAVRFWRDTGAEAIGARAVLGAMKDALVLEYLKGGGEGCPYPDEHPSATRRVFHHLVFWGFMLDLVATTAAAIMQDFFEIMPPYPLLSVPVVCGSVGGLMLVVGATALIRMKLASDTRPASLAMLARDYGFLVSLDLVGITGFLVLALRDASLLGPMLVLHLGTVAGLFLTTPYGKFAHVIYRGAALVRNRIEMERMESHEH